MKRIILLLLAAAALLTLCCCTKKPPDGAPSAEAPTGGEREETVSPSDVKGGDERVSYILKDNKLTVTLALPGSAGKPVSLLLLTDGTKTAKYLDDPSLLIDIDEATPDENGNATVEMTLDGDVPTAFLVVTLPQETITWRVR